jgi:hypothetical protein
MIEPKAFWKLTIVSLGLNVLFLLFLACVELFRFVVALL